MGRMRGESEIRADQIRAEQASNRKFIEVELRSLVREASELLSREDKPDWVVVRLLLNNATGRATEIVAHERRVANNRLGDHLAQLADWRQERRMILSRPSTLLPLLES